MSPALNGSSAIRRFEGSDAIEIRDGITFDFYMGLPHIHYLVGEKAIWLDIARVCNRMPAYFYEPPVNESIVRELINNAVSPR